jgi:hypothetical protein
LCCTVQRSVSCAESVQAALLAAIQGSAGNTASSTEKQTWAVHQTNIGVAGGTAGGKASSPQQQQQQQALPVEPGMLVHVLGAELAALKDAAKALRKQLQQGGTQQQQQQQQQSAEFSFRTVPGTASEGSISLDGNKGSTEQHPQQQQQSATTGGGASAAVAAAAADGAVMVSPTVLQELQAAAQQQQRRCGKWKARCKQLAQQLSLLTAQWSAAQNRTLPAAAAVADDATPQQQQQQADADAAGPAAEPAGEPSAQHMAAVTAAGLAGLLSRLDEFETHLDSRLQQSLGASGAVLARAEGVAADVAATADALDGRVLPLLGCAAGLEAQIAALDQKLQEVQQQHELAAAEQQSALAGENGGGGRQGTGGCSCCWA